MTDFNYQLIISRFSEKEGSGYVVEFTDLPGCIADGETIEEALAEAEDALNSWLQTAKEFGDEIPSADQYSGQWKQRAPKSIYAELAKRAKQEGISINALVSIYIAEGLVRHERYHSPLPDPKNRRGMT